MDFIIDNFDKLFDSEEHLKKLEEIILDLAVKGKLVPQNPDDEPASVLLEKIKTEKEKLIKEKKIKKDKELEPINEEEKPFEIPDSWEWVRLGEIGNIFNGDSINEKVKKEKYENIKDGYCYIGTKDVDKDTHILNYENGVKIPFYETKFKIAHKYAVLICSEGGSAGKKIGVSEEDICFGNKLFANECYIREMYNYIFYNYKSIYFFYQFSEKMTGIIGGISTNKFKEISIPLPPLAEQKRIVEKVDSLKKLIDTLKEKTKGRDKTREELKKSIMAEIEKSDSNIDLLSSLEMVFKNFDTIVKNKGDIKDIRDLILSMAVKGKLVPQNPEDEPASILLKKIKKEKEKLIKEKKIKKNKELDPISDEEKPFEIPDSWEWVRLGEVIEESPRNGYSPKAVEFETETRNLKLGATTYGKFNKDEFKYIDEKIDEESHLWLKYGDILIQRSNGLNYVGVSCIFDINEKFIYPDLMMKIRVVNFIENKYIYNILSSITSREYYRNNATGTSKSMPKINQSIVSNTLIPLPPFAEQKRIVEKVDKLMALCDNLEKKVEKSQKEFEKILESAVQGVVEG